MGDGNTDELGVYGPVFEWVVEAGKIHEFATAILADNSEYQGSEPIGPPTFPQVASRFWEPPESRPRLAQPMARARLLHGEQEYEFDRPIAAGELLSGRTQLIKTFLREGRRGGSMRFAVFETVFYDRQGKTVVRARSTQIETEGAVQ